MQQDAGVGRTDGGRGAGGQQQCSRRKGFGPQVVAMGAWQYCMVSYRARCCHHKSRRAS